MKPKSHPKKADRLPLVTPGEILEKEFMEPLGLSAYRVAKDIHTSPTAIGEIIRGTRAITAETAWKLGAYFGMSAQFWLNAQADYELRKLVEKAGELPKIERCAALAA
ncbi:MAG TPA: HigA family addiction module antitoxin [Chthoniobacterales bacterium]